MTQHAEAGEPSKAGRVGGGGRRGKPGSTLLVIELENLPLQRPKQFKFKQLKLKRNQFKQRESILCPLQCIIGY